MHCQVIYPWRQGTDLVLQKIHTMWQVIPLASHTHGQVSLYQANFHGVSTLQAVPTDLCSRLPLVHLLYLLIHALCLMMITRITYSIPS